MLRKIEDFQKAWQYEAESTEKVLRQLTDASLSQPVAAGGRTLGGLAWHLVQTLGEMPAKVGLVVDAPKWDAPMPATAAEIADSFAMSARSLSDAVGEDWTDETLLQTDEMYGEVWPRGLTLFYVITHQAHHRGQMTVLMRQAGLAVPGVYGPAREEWEAMGVPAMP